MCQDHIPGSGVFSVTAEPLISEPPSNIQSVYSSLR